MPTSQQKISDEVAVERGRQLNKWGAQNHDPAKWMLILGEEFGEAAKEACEAVFVDRDEDDGDALLLSRLSNLRDELIQVAAVAQAFVESLDRNELKEQTN
jgi:hypothetical protein